MEEVEGLTNMVLEKLDGIVELGGFGVAILTLIGGFYQVRGFFENRKLEALDKNQAYRLAKELVQSIKATIDAVECSNKLMWSQKLSTWLRQLNDMAYEVEDLVDKEEFMMIREKMKGKRKFNEFKFNFYQMNFANYSTNLFDNIVAEAQREITYPNYSPSITKFVCRAKEKEMIKNWLGEHEENKVEVIPIVGIGGVGKTALAQYIYHHEVERFELRGRAHLSDSSHIIITIHNLKRKSGEKDLPVNDFNTLNRTLCGKRFFLVLDDVRNNIENQWNYLFAALESGAPGSKVLITTQSHKIARRIGTVKPINLDVLEPEAMLTLFEHHALGGVEIDEEKERVLRSMSSNIITNLCGLPLAAKIIGNMLRSTLNEREWRRVSELPWGDFKEAIDGILPSLLVGYQQLEAGQRKCFAYCCIFPKDHIFLKERLVQMWIANDFIPQNEQEMVTMEDIGRQWFDDLVEKSFIQQPDKEKNEFTMSSLMRGLAVVVSTAQNLSFTEESSIPSTVRHLSLPASKLEVLCDIASSSTLRTIILSGNTEINKINMLNTVFRKLSCLRVLQLSGISMQELPYAIRYLLHLRYLDLANTGIRYLNESICRCYHLQVLDLEGCNIVSLPDGITDLINLRHLYADSKTISLISGIGHLANLQELYEFHIGKERGYKIVELKNMRFLSELHIRGIENVSCSEEVKEANLIEKKNLEKLGLYSKRPNFSKEILQALQPHSNLKELIISGYEGFFLPEWFQQLTSIQKITIENCPQLMSMDGVPPMLQELTIKECSEQLMEQCIENGAQWPHIEHVQSIYVGDVKIK
ncbi:putative disease resistance protein RGA4 [Carex rostrata]